jgi:quercetin dioxygenase-like cupin family protein
MIFAIQGREEMRMLSIGKLDETLAKRDPSPHFDGTVRTYMLVGKEQSAELEILAVFFNAGARTRPHVHAKDQVLHFVQGKGIIATETSKQVCAAGDIVTVPGGQWHWHGATRDQAMCHISIRQPGATDWDVDLKNWSDY